MEKDIKKIIEGIKNRKRGEEESEETLVSIKLEIKENKDRPDKTGVSTHAEISGKLGNSCKILALGVGKTLKNMFDAAELDDDEREELFTFTIATMNYALEEEESEE